MLQIVDDLLVALDLAYLGLDRLRLLECEVSLIRCLQFLLPLWS